MKNTKNHNKVTINDVAEAAGVSAMTVSRVIRNQGNIAPETRENILRVINELNYEPLSYARNLSGSFPRNIGIVIPNSDELRQLRHGYEYEYALLIGALNVCKKFDFTVNITEIRSTNDIKLLVKRFYSRQVGGYIVAAPATEYMDLTKVLSNENVIFSTISAYQSELSKLAVLADERAASKQITEQLIEYGHKNLAFIGGLENHRATYERKKGFLEAIEANPNSKHINYQILNCEASFEGGHEIALNVLANKGKPTAIQCLTDDIAAGVMAAATKLDIQIPSELSVCGFDDFSLARKLFPGLTTAKLPAEEMAEAAALQVIQAIEKKTHESHIKIDCKVIFRDSTAPLQ